MPNKIRFMIFILLAAITLPSIANDLPMLKAQDTFIIDDSNKTVILKGCNIGNWFLLEMWMLHLNDDKIIDHYTFEENLEKRFGEQEKNRLMEIFRANWITDRDFEIIKSFGMNCVRLPIYYNILEDDNNPMKLKPDAFKWLDYAINTAEKNGLYTIIDLHGAPGGQSEDHTTGKKNSNQLWSNPINIQRTRQLWRHIADRYKQRGCIAGYDLLNEPWGVDINEQVAVYDLIYKTVREVDQQHIIFIEGHQSVKELGNPKERNWQNVAYSLHKYPGVFDYGLPNRETHTKYLKIYSKEFYNQAKDFNVPFLMGEFNVAFISAGGAEMTRRHFDTYENYGWASTIWSYKLLTIPGEKRRAYWEMVTNKEPLPKIDFKTASIEEIENFFKFLSSDYVIYDDLKKALTQKEPLPPLPDPPPPPKPITSSPAIDKFRDFTATDVSAAMPGGQKVYSNSKIDLYACGEDIYLTNDQFRFLWKKLTGDCEISATIDSLTFTHMYAKAGIMIRGDLADDSVLAMLNVIPSGNLQFICRYQKAEKTRTDGNMGYDFPDINIKLVRKGQTIESYHCKGNEKWEKFMTVTLPDLPQTVYVGLCCLSHDNTQLAKAVFKNIKCSN